MKHRMTEFFSVLTLRVFLGTFVSIVLGGVGYLIALMALPPVIERWLFIVVLVCGSGLFAGLGGLAVWGSFQRDQTVFLRTCLLSILGGLAGAWGGFVFARLSGADVFPPQARVATILASGVGVNLANFIAAWCKQRTKTPE